MQRARHGESMGLLSIEERIRLANGQIQVESIPNRGTEIRIEFPLS